MKMNEQIELLLNGDNSQELMAALNKITLLSPDTSNAKLGKNSKYEKYVSSILYMSPSSMAFKALGASGTLCPMASNGCAKACLNTAGRGRFKSVSDGRLRKALYYIRFKDQFLNHLRAELTKFQTKALKKGKIPVVRLNGTTDIMWPKSLFFEFPQIQFYDYTKIPKNAIRSLNINNYHITFSASENNHSAVNDMLSLGVNVAMVFNLVPNEYQGVTVISGDDHDLRILDPQGVIVGLKAKGKAKQDSSGFVRHINQNDIKERRVA